MIGLVQRFTAAMNKLSTLMGYLAGGGFLLLSCYIGWEAVARKFGLPYSGFSDEISSYTLAVAGCWGMSYAMKEGNHVRIEVVTSLLPKRYQQTLLTLAIFIMVLFGGFLAYHMWLLALESNGISARGISSLRAPLVIPQGFAAFGLTVLVLQGLAMFLCRIFGIEFSRDSDTDLV